MTITAISSLAQLSSTSVATYGGFKPAAKGIEGKTELIANLQDTSLGGGFTPDQAKYFADRYPPDG